MKKFIIIIVFVFLIGILISFNYLLWDREKQLESFQDISDSKNLTIDALSEKMNTIDKLNKELDKRVKSLTDENTEVRNKLTSLSNESAVLKQQLVSKNALISELKKLINIDPMTVVVKKWVEDINSKNYKSATALIVSNSKDTTISDAEKLKEAYQNEVKAIRFKNSKIYAELADEDHLAKMQLEVVVEVDKPESSDAGKPVPQNIFKSGENTKYFTMEFDPEENEWFISEIQDKP